MIGPWDILQENFINSMNSMNNTTDAGHLSLSVDADITNHGHSLFPEYRLHVNFISGDTNSEDVQFTDVQQYTADNDLTTVSPTLSFAFSTQENYSGGTGGTAPYVMLDASSNQGISFDSEALTGITSNTVQISTIEYHREGRTLDDILWSTTLAVTTAPTTAGETSYLGEVTVNYTTSGGDDDDAAVALGIKNAFEAVSAGDSSFVPSDHITFSNSGS